MAYPGEEYTMSNYGLKERSPQEIDGHWIEYCNKEKGLYRDHIAIKGDGSKSFPGIAGPTQEQLESRPTYCNNNSCAVKREYGFCYDRLFHSDLSYNSKLHRDDRQHTVGLDVHSEECKRSVPIRSSTEYGRRVNQPLEGPSRKYSKVERVMKGFYRTRGTGIPSSMD